MKLNKKIYQDALSALGKHYFLNVVIAFMVGVVLAEGYNYTSNFLIPDSDTSAVIVEDRKTNVEVLEEFIEGKEIVNVDNYAAETTAERYTMGYLSVIVNEITASGSLAFGILNGLNKIFFGGHITESVTIFVMVIIGALFWVFGKNLVIIGKCRYFTEHRRYPRTRADRLLFVYRTGNIKNAAKVMFTRSVRQALWNLTVFGGIIKHYEYMMIPYILAENPTITTKEAFELSKKMINGSKKTAFFIDLTLIPAWLLGGLTMHTSSFFFTDPYRQCVYSELYMELRAHCPDPIFRDSLLEGKEGFVTYPDSECPTVYMERRKWLATDYNKTYSAETAVLFFFLFSFIGYAWEVFFYLINDGSFVNRGTLTGPWLPIYGFGGLIIIYILKPLRDNPAIMFIGTFIVCGVVEYTTSWLLEVTMGQRWWDYTGYFMNLNGRICLEGLLVFGMAGVAMTYFIAPITDNILQGIPPRVRKTLCVVLSVLFLTDCAWSVKHPNTGEGITDGFY
ncbi:MAG: DUF975 family protein [Clostridia bacterium]|nr:DUF975 family protein [Clostridia bacterium]